MQRYRVSFAKYKNNAQNCIGYIDDLVEIFNLVVPYYHWRWRGYKLFITDLKTNEIEEYQLGDY